MPADWRIPPPYDDYDHSAIRAVAAGIATSEQAKHALDYILFIARAYENPFHSDSKIHAYLAGRRSVAVDIIKLINMKIKGQDESEHG